MINLWENSLNQGKCSKQSCIVFGWLSTNVTCSEWSFVEVVALFHNADVAVTSSGFPYMAESTVSTIVFPDGVTSCMETPIFFLLYISDSDLCFD